MISQWILEKLEPVKKEKLIILKDPQRMIRRGELIVDGWGEKNNFTVLLCTGNLYLRENYERIKNEKDIKILLVDKTRDKADIRLFYPDIEAQTGEKCKITLTLQNFLEYKTGEVWPLPVNDRNISRIIMEHIDGILEAHKMFRSINKTGFNDDDLYKIILGGVMHINPFKKRLTPRETRKVCIEQHNRIEELKNFLPENALNSLFNAIKSAPEPFCKLLDSEQEEVIRAFTLSAILYQHKLEYQILIGNIDPDLINYQNISPDFLQEALEEQSDPDTISSDVQAIENYLKENPDKLAFLLQNRLNICDKNNALQVLQAEKLSPLIKTMALLSLLADLIENRGGSNSVLSFLDEEEKSTGCLALKRPGEEWQLLKSNYIKTSEIIELLSILKKCVNNLQVTGTSQLKFEMFNKIWNEQKINRLDYYLSVIDRQMRIGNMLPVPRNDFWKELGEKWDKARAIFNTIYEEAEKYKNIIDRKFQDFYLQNYEKLIRNTDSPAVFTHQFLSRVFKPRWDPKAGEKGIIMIFDGLRVDGWEEFLKPVFEERFEVIASFPGSAILPTETRLSRKAICAGELPEKFTTANEKKLLENWFENNLGISLNMESIKDDDTVSAGMTARFKSDIVELIIFNFSDKNLHGNDQDLAFIYDTGIKEIIRQDVRSLLRELPDDILLFITSDHGFIEVPENKITISHSYTTEKSDVKYRVARIKNKLTGNEHSKVICFEADSMGIPVQLKGYMGGIYKYSYAIFPGAGYSFQRPGPSGGHKERYSHGGLSLAECMVPMIVMGKKDTIQKPLQIVKIEPQGAFEEGKEIEIIILVKAGQEIDSEITFTLEIIHEGIAPRKEIFSGKEQEYKIRWIPVSDKPEEIDMANGILHKNITVVGTYTYNNKTIRTSGSTDIKVRLDTRRVKRRLNSKLDMLMGKIPKGLI